MLDWMCSESDFPPGRRGLVWVVDGDSGDLNSNLGLESDPLLVLEKVTALCCVLSFPSPTASILPLQAADCRGKKNNDLLPL